MNPPISEPYALTVAALTDPGRARSNNEDYLGNIVPPDPQLREAYGALMVVCDGIGGHEAGEVASQHAVQRILSDYYQAPGSDPPVARLVAAIQLANQEVYRQSSGQPAELGMGTTVVAAVLRGSELVVAHAGDSRAYLIRKGQARQLTEDHSFVAELLRRGDITPEQAANHPWRNRITRYVGHADRIELDTQTIEVGPGDAILLCSDGLTRHVNEVEMAAAVAHGTAQSAARQLVDLANRRGGKDNISVIIAELAPLSTASGASMARSRPAGISWPRIPLRAAAVGAAALVLLLALVAIWQAGRLLAGPRPVARVSSPTPTANLRATAGAFLAGTPVSVPSAGLAAVIKDAAGAFLTASPQAAAIAASPNLAPGTAISITAWQIQSGPNCKSALWLAVQVSGVNTQGWICSDAAQAQGYAQIDETLLKNLGVTLQVAPAPAATPTAVVAQKPAAIATPTAGASPSVSAVAPSAASLVLTPLVAPLYALPRLEPLSSLNVSRLKLQGTLRTSASSADIGEVAFSPDGATLASASFDHLVRLWRVADGALLLALSGHTDSVSTVAFSPDGKLLASGSWDRTVRVWGADGKSLHVLKESGAQVESLAFSPDGRYLAANCWDGTVLVWDTATWGVASRLTNGEANRAGAPIASRHPAGIAFLGGGQYLAAGTDNGSIAVWSLAGGGAGGRVGGHTAPVWNLSASPGGERLASASADGTSRLWDFRQPDLVPGTVMDQPARVQPTQAEQIMAISFTRDGSLLASVLHGGKVNLWDPAGGGILFTANANATLFSVTFSPDRTLLAVGSGGGAILLWGVVAAGS